MNVFSCKAIIVDLVQENPVIYCQKLGQESLHFGWDTKLLVNEFGGKVWYI